MTRSPETIPEDVEIRVVTSPGGVDPRGIAKLNILAWGGHPGEGEIEKRAARLEAQAAGLEPNTEAMLVAEKSGAAVGFCRVVRDTSHQTHWWLVGVVVHPDERRRRIGRSLALEAIGYAQARGAAVIRSETHTHNSVSIRFHEALGFKNEGPFTASDGDRKIAFSLALG